MTEALKKVLIVEDDPEINTLLTAILRKNHLHTTSAYSGTEALLRLENERYDLLLIDLMLPGLTGEELIKKMRETSEVPIIVISAKADVAHKVDVLNSGADDYITKPFDPAEVTARIEVQLRKSKQNDTLASSWRELTHDKEKREIAIQGQVLSLTNAEYDILSLLMAHPEYAFSKRDLYERLWTGPYLGDDNTISVHVSNLRKKLAVYTPEEYIKTIWGVGFMLV